MDVQTFASFDGQPIAWREVGTGRPVVLLHGLFSDAVTNWIRFGTAAALAAAGCRVIVPDLRGHGASSRSHDPAAYPPDVLALDAAALVAHLGLTDYDLGGYSLGSRTTVRCLVRGMTPRRVVLAGMGLTGLIEVNRRTDWFLSVIADPGRFARGSPGWTAAQFMKTTGVDGTAVAHVLRSQVEMSRSDLVGGDDAGARRLRRRRRRQRQRARPCRRAAQRDAMPQFPAPT